LSRNHSYKVVSQGFLIGIMATIPVFETATHPIISAPIGVETLFKRFNPPGLSLPANFNSLRSFFGISRKIYIEAYPFR